MQYTNTYTYDDHGNMTSYNTTASNPIDTEVRWVYEYDDEGRITHETSYKQDGDVYNDWTCLCCRRKLHHDAGLGVHLH